MNTKVDKKFKNRKSISYYFKKIYNNYKVYNKNIINKTINKILEENIENIVYFQHSRLIIFLKLFVFAGLIFFIFPLYKNVGHALYTGFGFFRFQEIFTFKLPNAAAFQKLSFWLFFIIIAYYSLSYFIKLLSDFFSVLVITDSRLYQQYSYRKNTSGSKFFYIRNFLISKKTYIFSANELEVIELHKSIFSRIFNTGTVALQKQNGDTILISSLHEPEKALKYIIKKSEK